MRSYSDSHTPSHAHSQAHTTHPPTLPHMRYASWTSRPRPPGGEGGALLGGGFCWRRWTWLLGRVRPFVFQWVHSHTCLIAWPIQGGARRGCRPLESEGPENCNRFWFTSVHNYGLSSAFCRVALLQKSLGSLILDVLGDPWQTSLFSFVILSCFLKATAPITEVTSACLSTVRCRCLLFFATCSHSFSLAPTRHLKLHLGRFPWNAKWNPHIFLSYKMQPCIPRAKHNVYRIFHTLAFSLVLSLLIFFMLNRVLHREQNSRIPQMPSRTGNPWLARWLS